MIFDPEIMKDLDELFPQIGEYGRFQKMVLWLILFPILVPMCFTTFNQIFMTDVPQHWCRVPELEQYFNDSDARRFLSIPILKDTNGHEKCLRYKMNWTQVMEEKMVKPNSSWPVESCLDGWEYNTTEVSSSIVKDFDLVCDQNMYTTFGLVFLNLGGPLGILCFGLINDRFGRKLSLMICLTVSIISNVLTAFSPNIIFWIATRLALGTTIPALYQIVFILALEIVGQNYRSWVSVMCSLIFTFGLMALSGLTYLEVHWRYLALLSTAPFSPYLIILCFIPESPRWLMARSRHSEAFKVLKNIARINRKQLPNSFFDHKEMVPLRDSTTKSKKKEITVLDLFKTRNMRLKTILISFNWFVNEMVYYGLSWCSPSLGSEKHLSFFLSALVEIPSTLLSKYVLDTWGRKLPYSTLMIISGLSCFVTVLVPVGNSTLILLLFLTSKFAISSSYTILYTYAGELYPTDTRGLGLAISAYCSGIGRVFLPFVTRLRSEMLTLPLVILGILSFIGGISSLRLPETLNEPLPQTIAEGEEFGKNMSFSNCLKNPIAVKK